MSAGEGTSELNVKLLESDWKEEVVPDFVVILSSFRFALTDGVCG